MTRAAKLVLLGVRAAIEASYFPANFFADQIAQSGPKKKRAKQIDRLERDIYIAITLLVFITTIITEIAEA